VIGVTQYLSHVPAWLVEIHVFGAVALTIGLVQFNFRQTARDREPGTRRINENASLSATADVRG